MLARNVLMPMFMSRPLRYLFRENALVEVTTRTLQGRFLLRPSPALNERFVGILGRALESHSDIRLHAVAHMSNHYHLLLSVPDGGALASFMCFVNGNLAREAALLHDWPQKFWGRRYRSIEVLNEQASVLRLRYLLSHGVKEGLVARCLDWPGVNSVRSLLANEPLKGTWHNRTLAYEAVRRGLQPAACELEVPYEVHLAPLPAWEALEPQEQRDRVAKLVADIEQEAAANHDPRREGVRRVITKDPQVRPSRVARRPAPNCHATCPDLRARFRDAYRAFAEAFRDASLRDSETRNCPSHVPGSFPPARGYVRRLTRSSLLPAPAPT